MHPKKQKSKYNYCPKKVTLWHDLPCEAEHTSKVNRSSTSPFTQHATCSLQAADEQGGLGSGCCPHDPVSEKVEKKIWMDGQ